MNKPWYELSEEDRKPKFRKGNVIVNIDPEDFFTEHGGVPDVDSLIFYLLQMKKENPGRIHIRSHSGGDEGYTYSEISFMQDRLETPEEVTARVKAADDYKHTRQKRIAGAKKGWEKRRQNQTKT